MLEQLLKVIECDCDSFELIFKDNQYKLTLNDKKGFIGKDLNVVINDAVDYLDMEEFGQKNILNGYKPDVVIFDDMESDEVFRKVGYASEEHY